MSWIDSTGDSEPRQVSNQQTVGGDSNLKTDIASSREACLSNKLIVRAKGVLDPRVLDVWRFCAPCNAYGTVSSHPLTLLQQFQLVVHYPDPYFISL